MRSHIQAPSAQMPIDVVNSHLSVFESERWYFTYARACTMRYIYEMRVAMASLQLIGGEAMTKEKKM